jgi:hypothetical protein
MLHILFREISKKFIPESVVCWWQRVTEVCFFATVRERLKVKVAGSPEIFISINHNTQ